MNERPQTHGVEDSACEVPATMDGSSDASFPESCSARGLTPAAERIADNASFLVEEFRGVSHIGPWQRAWSLVRSSLVIPPLSVAGYLRSSSIFHLSMQRRAPRQRGCSPRQAARLPLRIRHSAPMPFELSHESGSSVTIQFHRARVLSGSTPRI